MNGRPLCKLPDAPVMMVDELIGMGQICWFKEKMEENFIETDR